MSYRDEKFSKEDAKLMEGVFLSPAVPSSSYIMFFFLSLLIAPCPPVPAFCQVLSGLWDVNEGNTVVNPQRFYNIFKEAVPYFSGYR